MQRILTLFCFLSLIALFQSAGYGQEKTEIKKDPVPKVLSFNPDTLQYQPLLDGEKDSVVFYSGVVTLLPNTAGELHSTEEYEEMIIVLEGEGILRITKKQSLILKYGRVGLVPPRTEHQIFNPGEKNLKYIYVATRSK